VFDRAQLQAPVVRLVQPVLGGVRRHLRPALFDGDLDGSQNSVIDGSTDRRIDAFEEFQAQIVNS
jgi:hypothetical protein